MKRWIWRRRPGPDQAGPHEHANKFPFYKSSEGYLRNFNEQSDVICDYKESHHDWTGQEQDGDRGASEKEGWGAVCTSAGVRALKASRKILGVTGRTW